MTDIPKGRIPTPIGQRLRNWRSRALPLVVWVGAIGCALVIAGKKIEQPSMITGIAEVRELHIAPPLNGRLEAITVSLFDHVNEGDVIARLDGSHLAAEFAVAQAELERMRLEVPALQERFRREDLRQEQDIRESIGRFLLDEQEARIEVLDREASLEVNRIESTRLEILLSRLEQLLDDNIIDPASYDETFYAREGVLTRIREGEVALAAAKDRLESAREELKEQRNRFGSIFESEPSGTLLAPLTEALNVQQARLEELSTRREQLVLRAPMSGRISQLLVHTGQNVFAGEPFAVLTNENPERVVAYVSEHLLDQVQVGTRVEVQTRRVPPVAWETQISRVGTKV
ncbi:MAG: biotin/lipoyl-binding protein, partial [Candidatus Sumerlaeia bacterium]|nr:biotin/lipoyl-binding protein [Candidatus Sumerlaeia bacterium]